MKKALLFISVFFFTTKLIAQILPVSSRVRHTGFFKNISHTTDNLKYQIANKTTGPGGDRWYNYASYQSTLTSSAYGYEIYLYFTNDKLCGNYDTLVPYCMRYDTLRINTYATSFDPTYVGFNDSTIYPGVIAITPSDAYTVDTVGIWGYYTRNLVDTISIDTLRVTCMYGKGTGTNLPIKFLTGMTNYCNYDTVYYASISEDIYKHIGTKDTSSTDSVIVKDILLTYHDTAYYPGLGRRFNVELNNFNVPANDLTAVTVTFKTGEIVPAWDTIYTSWPNTLCSFPSPQISKHGLFHPFFFGISGLQTYFPGYFNTGYYNLLPDTGSWQGSYVPEYSYCPSCTLSVLQTPDIDFHVHCGNCNLTNRPAGTSVKLIL